MSSKTYFELTLDKQCGCNSLPHLTAQWLELSLELFVGLLLLLQVSLKFLFVVFQSVDLLFGLIHLPLQSLQTQVQLHRYTTWQHYPLCDFFVFLWVKRSLLTWSFWSCSDWCSSSTCIIVSFTLRSSRRFASCRFARSLHKHMFTVTFLFKSFTSDIL